MTNKELKQAFIDIIKDEDGELYKTHPTVLRNGTRFIDYTEDGILTMEYPILPEQCNGMHILQGGNLLSFIDDNFGLFVFLSLEGKPAVTVNMDINFHKSVTVEDGYVRVVSRVVSAGKKMFSLRAEAFAPDGKLIATCTSNVLNLTGAYLSI